MGKRKTKRKPQARVKAKLETQFNCLFCNHEKSVTAKLHAIDVYSDWIDACEENNRGGAGPPPPAGNAGREIYVDPSSARGYEFEVEQNDRLPTHARVEGEGEEETEEVDEDRERYRWLDANPRSPAPPRHVEEDHRDEEDDYDDDDDDVEAAPRAGTREEDDDEEEEPAVGSRTRRITHYFGSDEEDDDVAVE